MSINAPASKPRRFHAAVWRWHFYAGLVVMPFFVMAALTGMIMVLKTPVSELVNRDRLTVAVGGHVLPASAQIAAVTGKMADATVLAYLPPVGPERSAAVHVLTGRVPAGADSSHAGHGADAARSWVVNVDPYTGDILGLAPLGTSPADFAEALHGTLFLGAVGDVIIECVAGFGILLVLTGLYLYWPAGTKRVAGEGRALWRRVHGWTGIGVSAVLLFFLVSGLAWTPVWGGKLTQAWGSFPAERFAAPSGEARHAILNSPGARIVPWALEQTPLPVSGHDGRASPAVTIDDIVVFASQAGFTGYRILPPHGAGGTWTISATTMSGDVADPRLDRTVHIDPQTGIVLGDAAFAGYSPMGRAMAAGISLHMGHAGPWNIAINLLLCCAVLAMAVSGTVMWWLRRPTGVRRLGAPVADGRRRWIVAGTMLAAALVLPVTAAVMAVIYLAEIATGYLLSRKS